MSSLEPWRAARRVLESLLLALTSLCTKSVGAAAIWLRVAEICQFVVVLLLLGSRVWSRKTSRSALADFVRKMPEPQNIVCLLLEFLQIHIRKSFRRRNQQGIEKDT